MFTLVKRYLSKAVTSPEQYYGPSVTLGETLQSSYAWDAASARAVQSYIGPVWVCAKRVSELCASATIRLYKPIRGGKSNVSRSHKAWMRHGGPSGPGPVAAKMASNTDDFVEITDHPVLDLLKDPSTFEIGVTSTQLRFLNRMLAGDAYVLKERGRSGVTALYDLCPAYVRIKPSKTNFVDGYFYGRDTTDQVFYEPEEVMHFVEERDPQVPYRGRGVMSAIYNEHQFYLAATQKGLTLMKAGGQPNFALSTENPMTRDQVEQLRQQVRSKVQGVNNAGEFIILPKSVELKPLAFAPKDLGEIEAKRYEFSVIAAAFGIAESEVFMNSANLASAEMGHVSTMRIAVTPRLQKDAAGLTSMLLPDYPDLGGAWLAYDSVIPEDEVSRSTVLVSQVGAGLLTPDEARAELGFEPLPNGLGAVPRFNGTPLDKMGMQVSPFGSIPTDNGSANAQEQAGEDAGDAASAGGDGGDGGAGGAGSGIDGDKGVRRLVVGTGSGEPAGIPQAGRDAANGGGDTDRGRYSGPCEKDCGCNTSGQRDAIKRAAVGFVKSTPGQILDPSESQNQPADVRFYYAMRKQFKSQRDSILDAMDAKPFGLAKSAARKEAFTSEIFGQMLKAWGIDPRAWDDPMSKATTKFIHESIRVGAEAGIQDLEESGWQRVKPVEFYTSSEPVVQAAARRAEGYAETIVGVNDETARRLGEAITTGLQEADSLHRMKQRIRDAFDADTPDGVPISDYRAAMIARTETTRAQVDAKLASWKATEAVAGKRWMLSPDACEFCEAVAKEFNGKNVGLDDAYYRLGQTITGTDGGTYAVDYEDLQAPPLHPHDRCTVVPILRGG